jgi:phage FluMu protein Com
MQPSESKCRCPECNTVLASAVLSGGSSVRIRCYRCKIRIRFGVLRVTVIDRELDKRAAMSDRAPVAK